jgi:hypothetical protein
MSEHAEAIQYWDHQLKVLEKQIEDVAGDLRAAAELVRQASTFSQVKRLEHLFYGATVLHPFD